MTNIYRLIVGERERAGRGGGQRQCKGGPNADVLLIADFTKCYWSQRVIQNVLFMPRCERK